MSQSPYMAVNREQALTNSRQHAEPYVHLGHGQYAQFCAAVRIEGTDQALTYAGDDASLLVWPNYPEVLGAALSVLSVLPTQSWLRQPRQEPLGSEALWRALIHEVRANGNPEQPLAEFAARTADELEHALADPEVRTTPRSQEAMTTALEILSVACAAVLVCADEEVDTIRVREAVAILAVLPSVFEQEWVPYLLNRYWSNTPVLLSA